MKLPQLAAVLLLFAILAPSSQQQDGVILDQWEFLDSAVDPGAFAAADAPKDDSNSGTQQRRLLSLQEHEGPLPSGSPQRQLLSLESEALPPAVYQELSRHRALLEAGSKQLAAAVMSTEKQQAVTVGAGERMAGTAGSSAGAVRRLKAVNVTKQRDILVVSGRVNLLMSDAWNVVYGAFKAVRAAFNLLTQWFTATMTGTLYIDNMALLQFSQNVADLQAQLSDTVSRAMLLGSHATLPLVTSKTSS